MLIQKARIPFKELILFGFLPSCIKKVMYRLRGYRIGKHVSIGFGSVICSKLVEVGDYTSIGFFTIIRGKSIKIGAHVSIGATTFLDTPYIEIGEGTKINEQVFVGGLQWHDSKFIVGKNCQIMQMSFINPAISITIGDDSGVGGNSLIFGHASWQSVFDGYSAEFAPIEIGNSVALTWRTFVMPGVNIGDGSVIGPGSLVNRNIPENCLAAGFPVRVISKSPDFPRQISSEEKIRILEDIQQKMLSYFSGSGLECSMENSMHVVNWNSRGLLRSHKHVRRMIINYNNPPPKIPSNPTPNLYVSLWAIPDEIRRDLNKLNVLWFDIERKERSPIIDDLGEEVSLFLRRFGVRFNRINNI